MLSRVADALFWMSRYLERAEQVSRSLDITFHLELDLHGVAGSEDGEEWNVLFRSLNVTPPAAKLGENYSFTVLRWLTLDMTNFGSIMNCMNRSRNNARSIRDSISSEMWRSLNKLYWRLNDRDYQTQVTESLHDFCETVQNGTQLFHGVCDTTLTHDEGWHFIQLGRYLERAQHLLMVLRAQLETTGIGEGQEELMANLHWAAVLKICAAYDAYRRLYISRVDGERVLEFLLLNLDFPHSVRFCATSMMNSLTAISGDLSHRSDNEALRHVGRLVNELTYLDNLDMSNTQLIGLVNECLNRCTSISRSMQKQYALH